MALSIRDRREIERQVRELREDYEMSMVGPDSIMDRTEPLVCKECGQEIMSGDQVVENKALEGEAYHPQCFVKFIKRAREQITAQFVSETEVTRTIEVRNPRYGVSYLVEVDEDELVLDDAKFVGLPYWAVFYWEIVPFVGTPFVDETGTRWEAVRIEPDDRKAFEVREEDEVVIMRETEKGKVEMTVVTWDEYQDILDAEKDARRDAGRDTEQDTEGGKENG